LPALIAALVPILTIEGVLAALTSFTLGLPWWLPLVLLAIAVALVSGLGTLANRWREGLWSGLAVLRSARGGVGVVALVLVAVFAQIARNWLMLHAVGAAAVVVILGANGVALAAAAGVLLTATGTAGAIAYAAWAGSDRLWMLRPSRRRAALSQLPATTQPAMGGIR
jgi:hypothetical protein